MSPVCWHRSLLVIVLCVTSAGCSDTDVPATGVLIDVDAQAAVRARAERIHLTVQSRRGDSGSWKIVHDADMAEVVWPFNFALQPAGGDAGRSFHVLLQVFDDEDEEIGRELVISSYRDRQVLVLRVLIEDACIGFSCEEEQTCTLSSGAARCVTPERPAGGLPISDPGEDLTGQCNENNGGCGQTELWECFERPGEARPVCDRNECGTNNGGCEQACTNSLNSFACGCDDEHALGRDGKSCLQRPLGSVSGLLPEGMVRRSAVKLAADKDGNVTAVWSAQEGTGAVHLWSNRYVPSTGWGDPRVVDSEGTSAQEIQLSVSRAGHAALVWLQQDSAKKAWVWGNQYMSGAGWSGPAKLKADSVHASERPYVGVDPAGNAMAVWHQSDGTRTNIWSNRFQPSVGWGTALTIDSSDEGCSGARVVLRDDGSAIVAFQQNSSTRPLLYWNEYAPMATREWGTAVYLRADFVGSPSEPLLAADVAGNLMAVWSQTNLGPRPVSSLYASRRQSAGGWEKSEPIGSAYSTEVRDLELAMNAAGGVITVWTQSDGTRDTVFANRYEPNVGWGKASSLFEPQQKSPGSKPAVAINDAGDAIVVWQSADQGQTSLIYRRFQLGNGWLAATTLVESDDTYPSEPRVVLAADGRVMVAWNESRAGSARAFATSF